jgi:hypothetical protein
VIRRWPLLLPLLLGVACTIGGAPTTIPLRGPSPAGVLVWPVPIGAVDPGLVVGVDAAIRERGYRVPSLAVGRELLHAAGIECDATGAPSDWAAIGRAADVDAVLLVVADEFVAEREPWRAADWSLRWQLWSTRGHGLLWEAEQAGAWRRNVRDDAGALERADDAMQPVELGSRRASFRSCEDLVRSLHRSACLRLPRRSEPS